MHPTNLSCPQCGAQPGHPCTNAWGYPVAGFHGSRDR